MIRFGTSGWRGIISDEFTFANVRKVTRAIAAVLRDDPQGRRAVGVGHDTRFLGERFAGEVASVLQAEGFEPLLAPEPLPTPVLAFAITHGGLAGGVNVTASHNPPEYNGLKLSTGDGAPAPPQVTRKVEEALSRVGDEPAPPAPAPPPLRPAADYFARLDGLVDGNVLKGAGLRVAVDARFGTTRGWLDRFLEERGVEVVRVNDRRDPLFGGGTPDCSGDNLDGLRQAVVAGKLHAGLATDGDGDRFGVVDADGTEITPNLILALLADHLVRTRGWREGIGRTVATTHLLDRVAAHHGVPVHETPVGFKYFQPLLAAGEVFMGCEESAGLSVKGHVPEKDGILAAALVAELVAAHGAPLRDQIQRLYRQVGTVLSRRLDRRFAAGAREELERRLARPPEALAGVPVAQVVRLDGHKWVRSDGAWLLVRLSGTEPVVRIYAEAEDETSLRGLLDAGLALLP